MENTFVTITGVRNYYGMKPFRVGKIFRIVKEDDNEYDEEAIRAELPMIDTIGYVANSANTVFAGTVSAGRLYDKIDDYGHQQQKRFCISLLNEFKKIFNTIDNLQIDVSVIRKGELQNG